MFMLSSHSETCIFTQFCPIANQAAACIMALPLTESSTQHQSRYQAFHQVPKTWTHNHSRWKNPVNLKMWTKWNLHCSGFSTSKFYVCIGEIQRFSRWSQKMNSWFTLKPRCSFLKMCFGVFTSKFYVCIGEIQRFSRWSLKMNSWFTLKPRCSFLKMWDQMKPTLFSSLHF
jgi:hypothetical protein